MQTKRLKAWLYPAAAEREYVKLLDDYAKELQNDVLKSMSMRQDAEDDEKDTNAEEIAILLSLVMGVTLNTKSKLEYILAKIESVFKKVVAFNYTQFAGIIKSAYGVEHVKKREPWIDDILKQWSLINAELISGMGIDFQRKIAGIVSGAVTNGSSIEDVRKQILKVIDMPIKRAELIAVDQVQKLNGQLMRERQERLGVKQYKWRGRLDARERPEHVAREGKIYSWDNPPYDGHPSVPIRCRCWAEMIPPPLEDLDLDFIGGNK